MLIVTGDRDSLQLVSDDVTVLYPRKGVTELTRITPEAVLDKYGLTPQQYPDFAALRGDPSDNLPGIPGVGEKTAAKWIAEYGSLQALVDSVDAVQGQGRRRAARQPGHVVRNRRAHRAGPRRPAARRPPTCCAAALGPRPGPPAVRRPGVPGAARPAVRHARRGRAGGRRGLRRRAAARWRPGDVAQWLAAHAADGRRAGVAVVGTHAVADGDATAVAIAAADGAGRLHRHRDADAEDEAALGALAGRPGPAEGAARRQGADARPGGARLAAARASPPTPRWPPTWCGPGQRSFDLADLSLRYLRRELRADDPEQAPALAARRHRRRRRPGRADPDPAGPGRARPGRRAGRRAGPNAMRRAARRGGAAAAARARRDGDGRHRRRPRAPRRPGGASSPRRSATPPRRPTR